MTNKRIVGAVFALLVTVVFAAAQASQGAGQPQNPVPQPPSATAPQPTTTLVGCLYREDQIPGRKPNVAERAGVLEDYILADAAIPPTGQAKPGATPGATAAPGTTPTQGNMFKVENIPDEKLKSLVGKRVEVAGKIDPEGSPMARPGATGAPKPDRGLGPDKINLPEFEAASIREVSGTCPPTPAPRK